MARDNEALRMAYSNVNCEEMGGRGGETGIVKGHNR